MSEHTETNGQSRSSGTKPPEISRGLTSLPWYGQLLVIGIAIALIFSRQPDALLHAQFFAEDGKFWFADAFNDGWFISLFKPQDGYFQTLPRFAASLSLLAPMVSAPLVMNLVGLLIQLLPVPVLLSSRLSSLGTVPLRAMLAFTYLALPNSAEMNVTIEEGQWHLALLACLLLLGAAPERRPWKILDGSVFVICGLTGPFGILLTPVAALRMWRSRERFPRWLLFILCATGAVQIFALFTTPRQHWPLGASIGGLVKILASQVFLGTILGSNWLAVRPDMPLLLCVAIAGFLLLICCFWNAGYEWKLLLLFSLAVFAASLSSPFTPAVRDGSTSWDLLAATPGIRYWFFPDLAFAWTIVWYLFGRPYRPICHRIGFMLILLMVIGVVRDWRLPPHKDLHFAGYVEQLKSSTPGTVLIIPENPDGWTMRLVKR